jgi:hypothetical protein
MRQHLGTYAGRCSAEVPMDMEAKMWTQPLQRARCRVMQRKGRATAGRHHVASSAGSAWLPHRMHLPDRLPDIIHQTLPARSIPATWSPGVTASWGFTRLGDHATPRR